MKLSWGSPGRKLRSDEARDFVVVALAVALSAVAGWLEPRGRWPYITAVLIVAAALAIGWRWHGLTRALAGGIAIFSALLLLLGIGNWMNALQDVLKGGTSPKTEVIPARALGSPSLTVSRSGRAIVNSCPNRTCHVVAAVPDGSTVYMLCFVDAQWMTDRYRSNRWFRIRVPQRSAHQLVGFIHSSDVIYQALTPRCRATK